jgi:mono/diheme cytochrome c family protein
MAAATDQTYRNQRMLDVAFGLSCVLMLVSVVWMFYDDQYRDWKKEQRNFFPVKEAMAQRATIALAPDDAQMKAIEAAQKSVSDTREKVAKKKQELQPKVDEWLPKKVKSENKFQDIKAVLDSKVSLYDIAVEERNRAPDPSYYEGLDLNVKKLKKEVEELRGKLTQAQNEIDVNKAKLAEVLKPVTDAEKELSDAEDKLKGLTGDFDRFHKLAERERWGTGDWFRSLPVIDAFASPLRIQQYTLDELPINYSFKYVTRYDRCTTCHLGIERPTFDKASLRALRDAPSEQLQKQLENARKVLRMRRKITGEKGGLDPEDLQLARVNLTDAQINEYAAHPRLDLFVDGNSPHSAEKFGCTICHAGQGSATTFLKASHMPDNAAQKHQWAKTMDWKSDHYWDFPMLPKRFLESSCVKCHHQMTDLIREGNREEAPKLLKGFNLVRENGCFGCHEIAGTKNGRPVGPDLRLEPTPPLDAYTPAERTKMLADVLNPPGTMRKVGPSLRRITEKTNADWMRKWIKAPRDFRPDTKMPHFYGLSNNDAAALKGTGQEKFPDAEITSITHFLLEESKNYLSGSDTFRKANQARLKELQEKKLRSEKEDREMEELTRRLQLFVEPTPLAKLLPQLPELPKDQKGAAEQLQRGRQLFSEKGCLACHINNNTATPGNGNPAISSDAHFGPNLTRLALKLGDRVGDEKARRWLIQWIMNPTIYHPRTFMPITHLDLNQANDVAAWLLARPAKDWTGPDVVTPDTDTLKKLARVALERAYSSREVDELLREGFSKERVKDMRFDQDERALEGPLSDDKLKMYVGKKAIDRMGCFGCHDIAGFEYAKPIGTPLNDWGKKDPERLAFEDVAAFVRQKHYIVDKPDGKEGIEDGKTPYERYFYESLDHHQREGFLFQKLNEPRSFDYDRMRAWDDRLRMPQFKFARTEQHKGESNEAYQARRIKEEAEAREAVMTFILGLVAEPPPVKFVYQAPPERQAEVKGRQVLDKFNCAGCHLVRPGIYDFKVTPAVTKLLQSSYETASGSFKTDHVFPDDNAWVGPMPTRPDRLTLFGINDRTMKDPDNESIDVQAIQPTRALRFKGKKTPEDAKETWLDIPATDSGVVLLPPDAFTSKSPPFGGTFGNLLVDYLVQRDKTKFAPDRPPERPGELLESKAARPAVPPALLREGAKTQPLWLYQFLKEPHVIRPVTVLRMPKFNMSDDEAMALVNYFSAADKLDNPASALHYPYFSVPERDESYLALKTTDYVARLRKGALLEGRVKELLPVWETQVKEQVASLEGKLKAADERLKAAQKAENDEKDPEKKKALTEARQKVEAEKKGIERELDDAKAALGRREFKSLRLEWEQRDAYLTDAYRLVANPNLCLGCHQVGSLDPKERQGPPLDLSYQRLRPEWTRRWLANPSRYMTYPTPMPQNFPHGSTQYQEFFAGSSMEQLTAARDFLMNYPRAIEMPANRNRPVIVPGTPGGK